MVKNGLLNLSVEVLPGDIFRVEDARRDYRTGSRR